MMEETSIINQVKEECCYVSQDVLGDLDICKKPYQQNTIIQEYVLPDYVNTSKGHIRPKQENSSHSSTGGGGRRHQKGQENTEQILTMNNERFMIPEILMHPSDIGIQQAGLAEAITQSVNACEPGIISIYMWKIKIKNNNDKTNYSFVYFV